MRKTIAPHLWLLLALLVMTSARADIVPGLHSARVPVADQGRSALAASARVAMSEVLVKVSGSHELLKNPAIKTALKDARNHVQQYAYVRADTAGQGLTARFEFDPAYITELVTRAGAPLWTANRPLVLAWVVVEDGSGRHFINGDTWPEESKALQEAFNRRGVPMQLPLFDLADTRALSPQDVWRLDAQALQAASARYDVQDVVAARLSLVDGAKVVGNWSYFYMGERIDLPITAVDLPAFLREGANVVAREMSARYAATATEGGDGAVRMSVTGVNTYADYAGIVSWLESLELIEYANIERVQGDRVDLRLGARADAARLAAIIELNTRLTPVPASGSSTQLNYQWQN